MVDWSEAVQHLINGVTVGSIYALTALGLTLVYGILKVLHIAHAGIYVIGAYMGFLAYDYSGNLALAFLLAVGVPALLGLLVERMFYLRLINEPRHVPLMISIALFILMEEVVANLFGHHPKGFHIEGMPSASLEFSGVVVKASQVIVVGVTLASVAVLWYVMNRSRMGLASQALIQDMETAKALGVNMVFVLDVNFIIGSALAGLAGLLVGAYYSSISPYMGDVVAYKALVVIVLGGFGSIIGALAGGIILGLAEEYLTAYLGFLLPREAYAFIALIVLLLVRPQGLFGKLE
ncbi:MAG: branched-chain amino acid ABC transporter permease [Desulfurococcales archaeon]|nr:branched-chain amino acid ABC transporter permease [Desulfurococcales archaeon]